MGRAVLRGSGPAASNAPYGSCLALRVVQPDLLQLGVHRVVCFHSSPVDNCSACIAASAGNIQPGAGHALALQACGHSAWHTALPLADAPTHNPVRRLLEEMTDQHIKEVLLAYTTLLTSTTGRTSNNRSV